MTSNMACLTSKTVSRHSEALQPRGSIYGVSIPTALQICVVSRSCSIQQVQFEPEGSLASPVGGLLTAWGS